MNEQQWQECPLDEATHARTATGKVYKLDDDNDIYIQSSEVRKCTIIAPEDFQCLGITPVKAFEVNPVEFTATFALARDGYWNPVYGLDDSYAYQDRPHKTFKCVEVQL